jgi:GT2 family glycosyltransferase
LSQAERRSIVCVIVTHNSERTIRTHLRALAPLSRMPRVDFRAIVVDNASADGTAAAVREEAARAAFPVERVESHVNAGWGAGNNLGVRAAASRCDAVLFLNPDIEVPPEALEALLRGLERHPEAGAAVPWVTDGAARPLPLARPTFTPADALLAAFGWRRMRDRRFRRRLRGGILRGGYAEGACLLVRRESLDNVGGFDERFFLFFDDADFSRRLEAHGSKIVAVEEAIVRQSEGKGSRLAPGASDEEEAFRRRLCFLRSELLYLDKHRGRGTARRIARAKILAELPLRALRWRRGPGIARALSLSRRVVREYLESPDAETGNPLAERERA